MNETPDTNIDPALAGFASQLKKAAPVACDELSADTFYQAGWEAAMSQLDGQRSGAPVIASYRVDTQHRSIGVIRFLSGVVCGVVAVLVISSLLVDTGGGDGSSVVVEQDDSPGAVSEQFETQTPEPQLQDDC